MKSVVSLISAALLFLPGAAIADVLLNGFVAPDENTILCEDVPVLERLKYPKCAFNYERFELQQFVDELAAQEIARREAEDARLWEWFSVPPIANDCDALPELEKAKFAFDCNPGQAGTSTLAFFEERLDVLLARRESLARRISSLQRDYEEYQSLASRIETTSTTTALPELETVLASLDATAAQADLLVRVGFELARRPELDQITSISIETAPAGLSVYAFGAPDDIVGTIDARSPIVALIQFANTPDDRVTLVHAQLGVVTALTSDFAAD